MKKTYLWLAVAISTFSLNATAVDLTVEIAPGYDDNPFRLADNLDPDGGWFLDTSAKLEHKADKIRLRGMIDNRAYEGSVDDADAFTAKLDGRYRTKYELAGKEATSHIKVGYTHKDKTYVARSTGLIGTDSGNNISDRYDYDSWEVEAKTAVNLTEALEVGLQLEYKNKDYEDYNIAGLSNLDYELIGLTNDWKYKIDKQSQFELDLNIANRDYDDKREKDLLGNKIAGTDLEYDYRSIAATYERDITKNLEASLQYAYEERRGSGSGYYDIDYSRASAKLRYKADDSLKITGGITYKDREYLNRSSFDEEDEASPSTEGYTVSLGMEKSLALANDFPTSLIARVKYDDYDSPDSVYEYDRTQVYAGIKIGFGK
jgi:hypothetical protein